MCNTKQIYLYPVFYFPESWCTMYIGLLKFTHKIKHFKILSIVCFLHFKIQCEWDREKEVFSLRTHSLNGCNSRWWARQKLGVLADGRGSTVGSNSAAFSTNQELPGKCCNHEINLFPMGCCVTGGGCDPYITILVLTRLFRDKLWINDPKWGQ